MGMFSWTCKGCGRELVQDERVRLMGCKGDYDGYGGVPGFDGSDFYPDAPACWHERCYQAATDAEKLDETPSDRAPNQGFGYPRAENVVALEVAFSILAYPPYVQGKSHNASDPLHEVFETLEEALAEDKWPDVAVMGVNEAGGETGVVVTVRGTEFE